MTTTSLTSENLTSSFLSNYSTTSSLHSFTRRHSIYGTEDRVVLDIGSLYIKCGFSGESYPRHLVPTWSHLNRSSNIDGEAFRINGELTELYHLDIMAKGNLLELEEKLKKLLHDIYFKLLLTEPKSRKVIICESPLLPIIVKQTMARILFDYFQVPSLSFVPIHLMALMTTGLTTGLVIDCGHLETTVLPIYSARPLIPYITNTPLAGKAVTKRLRCLLLEYGRLIPPSNLHISLTPQIPIQSKILTPELLEELKTRILFCSTTSTTTTTSSSSSAATAVANNDDANSNTNTNDSSNDGRHDTLSREKRIEHDKSTSHATDIYYPIQLPTTQEKATLLIPGWIREHAMDIVFEGNDDMDFNQNNNQNNSSNNESSSSFTIENNNNNNNSDQEDSHYEDEAGIAHCILNCLLKVPSDLRKPMMTSLLIVGGTALVPGFHIKLKQTLLSILQHPTKQEKVEYKSLFGLVDSIQFLDHNQQQQTGSLFKSNVRGWIGGSLVGYLKISGEEMVKDKFNGTVTDWSIGHWGNHHHLNQQNNNNNNNTGVGNNNNNSNNNSTSNTSNSSSVPPTSTSTSSN